MPVIQMVGQISGFRNGAEWPPRGGLLEVDELEAEHLTAAGLASIISEPKPVKAAVETAIDSGDVELATIPTTRKRRPVKES